MNIHPDFVYSDFRRFVIYHSRRWINRAPELTSEDLVQEVFLRFFEKGLFDQFDSTRSSFNTWLTWKIRGELSTITEKALNRSKNLKEVSERNPLLGNTFHQDLSDIFEGFHNNSLPQGTDQLRSKHPTPDAFVEQEFSEELYDLISEHLRSLTAQRQRKAAFSYNELFDHLLSGESHTDFSIAHGVSVAFVSKTKKTVQQYVKEFLKAFDLVPSGYDFGGLSLAN